MERLKSAAPKLRAALSFIDRYLLWLAFGLALIIRLVFVIQWHDLPYGAFPILDADAYDKAAQAIASGDLLRPRAFYQSPLYSYLLGFFYALFGRSFFLVSLLGAFLDAGTVAVLTLFTRRAFGLPAAGLTALLAALYRPMIFYSAPPMKEPLALFLLSLFMLFGLKALEENKRKNAALAGLFLGLGTLARSNALLLAPMFIFLAFAKRKKKSFPNIGIFILMLFLAIAPATIHNAIVSGDFVLTSYAGGFNLYIGHNPSANGVNAYPPEVSTDPMQEELNAFWIAQQTTGHDIKPSEISAFWRKKAVAYILANPWQEIVLLKNKIEAFFNGGERFDNYDPNFIAAHFGTLLAWPLPGFALVCSLAAFAFVPALARKDPAALFLLTMLIAYFLSVLPFYVTDRYRLPAVLFLFPMAGATIPAAQKIIASKNKKLFGGALAAFVLFAFLGFRPDPFQRNLDAYHWGTLTAAYSQLGQNEKVFEAFNKGLALPEGSVGSQAYIHAAYASERQGNEKGALRLLEQALTLFPQDATVPYNMGRLHAGKGELQEAQKDFETALRLDPSYVLTHYALAMIHEHRGNLEFARIFVSQGLAIDPGNAYLREIAARLKQQPGS